MGRRGASGVGSGEGSSHGGTGVAVGALVGAAVPGPTRVGSVSVVPGAAPVVAVARAGSGVDVASHESGVAVAVVITDDPGVSSCGDGVSVGVTGSGV